MEQLGAMEPERLLQLLVGVAGCAVTMFVLTMVYVILGRRSGRARAREGSDTPHSLPHETISAPIAEEVARSLRPDESDMPVRPAPLDVKARLAGTGRDAWQNQRGDQPSVSTVSGGQEILRVVQDPLTDQVWIKVAGVRYSQLSDIRDRSVGEQVLAAITCALRFSSGTAASDQGVVTIELPKCDAVAVPAPFGALSEAEEPGEVIRLLGEAEHNEFSVQVVSRRYRTISDVADPAVGQRILEGISHLLRFSRGRLSANDGVRVVPMPALSVRPAAMRVRLAPGDGEPRRIATSDEEDAFFRQLMSQSPQPSKAQVQRPSLAGSIRRLGKHSPSTQSTLTLAEEIDRILQRKLESSPLAHVDAQIVSRPDGSVRIRVGTQFYDRPSELSDAELRKIIEASIAEW